MVLRAFALAVLRRREMLPEGEHREHIRRLISREISAREDQRMVRWVNVHTKTGPIRALVFWADPKGKGISLKLPLERVAWVLARACGHGGSCASYLYNTVLHLDKLGIRDRNLWKLQELVANEILASIHVTPGVTVGTTTALDSNATL